MIGSSIGTQGYDHTHAKQTDLRRLYRKCYDVLTVLIVAALIRPKATRSTPKTLRILDRMSLSVETMVGPESSL